MRSGERFRVGYLTFPLVNWTYNRRGIVRRYRALRMSERFSPEKLRSIQLRRLRMIVRRAGEHVPYYRERWKAKGIDWRDIRDLSDLRRLPIVGRQDVIDYHMEMVDERFAGNAARAELLGRPPAAPIPLAVFRRKPLVRNTSSGSTGHPTVFYEDGSMTSVNWSHEMRLKGWFGVRPGAREARLVRMSGEDLDHSRSARMRKALWNQLLLPGVGLEERDYTGSYRKIVEFEPEVLWGFTSALYGLAEYMESRDLSYRPKVVIGWAAPLYDHERTLLERVFRCPATNIYGMREVGHIAGLCGEGNMHINQERYAMESVAEGEGDVPGELLVTALIDGPMPFIRYRTGDLGHVEASECPCGRGLEIISDFLGRTGEVHVTRSGRMISPNFWCRTFMDPGRSAGVKRFQVAYRRDGSIRLDIVRSDGYSTETEAAILRYLREEIGPDVKFSVRYRDRIEPTVSGKYQMVVKE